MTKASDLGMDLSGYGFANMNQHSGHVYLWLEDYPFTLYIGLGSDTIYALWINSDNGDEIETDLDNKSLEDLEEWANELYRNAITEEA